jgi:Tol biopolymer transport system component
MVRRMSFREPRSWLAGLLMFLAGGAVIWHLLACVESPMAFSPDGKRLAFTTMEPYGGIRDVNQVEGVFAGNHTFRVMVLDGGRDMQMLEETQDAMFSAPAWSPDGKRLVYLRIPLLPQATRDAPVGFGAPANPSGTLVIRDASDLSVVRSLPVELWGLANHPNELFNNYRGFRPLFSPDGALLYLGDGDENRGLLLYQIDPARGSQRILAPASAPALSPDGRYIAAFGDKDRASVYLAPTDGQPVKSILAIAEDLQPSWSGLAWLDNRTLVLLGTMIGQKGLSKSIASLAFVRTDGSAPPAGTKLLAPLSDYQTGELAIAPDGRHIVAAYGKAVFFMDANGKVLDIRVSLGGDDQNPGPGGWLVQPGFTPDSRFVAFKRVAEDPSVVRTVGSFDVIDGRTCEDTTEKGIVRTTEIVFFTPDGKEVRSVPVPAAAHTREMAWQLPR